MALGGANESYGGAKSLPIRQVDGTTFVCCTFRMLFTLFTLVGKMLKVRQQKAQQMARDMVLVLLEQEQHW